MLFSGVIIHSHLGLSAALNDYKNPSNCAFIQLTDMSCLLAPFSTAGRSPTVSLTVMARSGAPLAASLTAAYWNPPGSVIPS